MFSKSFTCSVTTDANGNFQASTPVSASHLISVHVDVKATLLSPADTELNGTFAIAGSQANQFHGSTNETVDLGSWKVPAGSTNPAWANTEISVRLDAHLV